MVGGAGRDAVSRPRTADGGLLASRHKWATLERNRLGANERRTSEDRDGQRGHQEARGASRLASRGRRQAVHHRDFEFDYFSTALAFVNEVGQDAEHLNHHPDIHILWNKVILVQSTQSAGGLTLGDFEIADGSPPTRALEGPSVVTQEGDPLKVLGGGDHRRVSHDSHQTFSL